MMEWVNGAGVVSHLAVPFKGFTLVAILRDVDIHIAHLIPKFPRHDLWRIAPTGDNVTDKIFRNPFCLSVAEKLIGIL